MSFLVCRYLEKQVSKIKMMSQRIKIIARYGLLVLIFVVQTLGFPGGFTHIVWHHEHSQESRTAILDQHSSESHSGLLPTAHDEPNAHVADGHKHHHHSLGASYAWHIIRNSQKNQLLRIDASPVVAITAYRPFNDMKSRVLGDNPLQCAESTLIDSDPSRGPPVAV